MLHPVCKTSIRSSLVCYCLIFPSSALSIRLPPCHVVFILLAALPVYVIISGLYIHDLLAPQVLLLVHHIHSPFFASHCRRCAASDRLSSISPSFFYFSWIGFSSVFCASFLPSLSFGSPPSRFGFIRLRREGRFRNCGARGALCLIHEVVQLPERSSRWLSLSSTPTLSPPVPRPPVVS